MSAIRPGWVGFQPVRWRVSSLEVGLSAPANPARNPKRSGASSGVMLTPAVGAVADVGDVAVRSGHADEDRDEALRVQLAVDEGRASHDHCTAPSANAMLRLDGSR